MFWKDHYFDRSENESWLLAVSSIDPWSVLYFIGFSLHMALFLYMTKPTIPTETTDIMTMKINKRLDNSSFSLSSCFSVSSSSTELDLLTSCANFSGSTSVYPGAHPFIKKPMEASYCSPSDSVIWAKAPMRPSFLENLTTFVSTFYPPLM